MDENITWPWEPGFTWPWELPQWTWYLLLGAGGLIVFMFVFSDD